MIIAIQRDVGAWGVTRRIVVGVMDTGCIAEKGLFVQASGMIMPDMLNSNMTIHPKTQHKGRRIAMPQAKMTKDSEDQHNREPVFGVS